MAKNRENKSNRAHKQRSFCSGPVRLYDPDRSGSATAIVVGDNSYLVDFGPGVVRRAEAVLLQRGIPAIEPGNLKGTLVQSFDHIMAASFTIRQSKTILAQA